MDYEKKLTLAKEALESGSYDRETIEYIFPELRQNEDDKIREALIDGLYDCMSDDLGWSDFGGVPIEDLLAWLERQGEQKSADKIEPKFRVKYAGNEYNVLDVKDIAGVTFYGIEDETNHIDYVKVENCERVGGYNIKENGFPYPTKPAVFSEQKPAWSEEDDKMLDDAIGAVGAADYYYTYNDKEEIKHWLKSLKERMKGE